MELFAGAALYALSNFYGTQKIFSVVNTKAHQHTIDFYNSFIGSVGTKYDAWNIFNRKHVAFDYNLPNVNMYETAKGEFTAYFSDDIWINRVEWLVSGVTQKVSTAPQSSDKFIMPVHLANSNQTVEIRVYDFEGAIRGNVTRMDIDLNIRRTQAYNNAIVNYKP